MDFMKTISIAASGLKAQSGRMRVIAENIANANSTAQTPGADPYRRRIATRVFVASDKEQQGQNGSADPKPLVQLHSPRASNSANAIVVIINFRNKAPVTAPLRRGSLPRPMRLALAPRNRAARRATW